MPTTATKLNDVFPRWLSGEGIFGSLQTLDVPWKNDNVALSLDVEYHGNRSGDKLISPLVSTLSDGGALSADDKLMLSTALVSICGNKWSKEYATLSLTYDPISNYDMTEIMSDDTTITEYGKTNTRTDNLSHTKTGTDTQRPDLTETTTNDIERTHTGTETQRPDLTETTTNDIERSHSGTETQTPNTTETTTPNVTRQNTTGIAGLNSGGYENANQTIETTTGNSTVAKTGTDTTTYDITDTDGGTVTKETEGTNTTTYNITDTDGGTVTKETTGTNTTQYNTTDSDTGTQTYRDTGTDTNTRNYTLTRTGNIGVTTSQQMIQSERELWLWDYFYNVVFPDIDRILTLPIY